MFDVWWSDILIWFCLMMSEMRAVYDHGNLKTPRGKERNQHKKDSIWHNNQKKRTDGSWPCANMVLGRASTTASISKSTTADSERTLHLTATFTGYYLGMIHCRLLLLTLSTAITVVVVVVVRLSISHMSAACSSGTVSVQMQMRVQDGRRAGCRMQGTRDITE